MQIQIDTREKERAIELITRAFDTHNVVYFKKKLDVGDYMDTSYPYYIIDRKQNLLELAKNVAQDHTRFTNEIKRAKANGIQLDFLVEHGEGIEQLEDVRNWINPRLSTSPMALSGERLYKILLTMEKYYGVRFMFCNKYQTGHSIVYLLSKHGKERI